MQNPVLVSCSVWYLCTDSPQAVPPRSSYTQYIKTPYERKMHQKPGYVYAPYPLNFFQVSQLPALDKEDVPRK